MVGSLDIFKLGRQDLAKDAIHRAAPALERWHDDGDSRVRILFEEVFGPSCCSSNLTSRIFCMCECLAHGRHSNAKLLDLRAGGCNGSDQTFLSRRYLVEAHQDNRFGTMQAAFFHRDSKSIFKGCARQQALAPATALELGCPALEGPGLSVIPSCAQAIFAIVANQHPPGVGRHLRQRVRRSKACCQSFVRSDNTAP